MTYYIAVKIACKDKRNMTVCEWCSISNVSVKYHRSESFEASLADWLGEEISCLVFGWYMFDGDGPFFYLLPNGMIPYINVLGPLVVDRIVGQVYGSLVIFVDSCGLLKGVSESLNSWRNQTEKYFIGFITTSASIHIISCHIYHIIFVIIAITKYVAYHTHNILYQKHTITILPLDKNVLG